MSKTKTTVTRTTALDLTSAAKVTESMGGRRATINDIARLAGTRFVSAVEVEASFEVA